jgi:hypothetical protein
VSRGGRTVLIAIVILIWASALLGGAEPASADNCSSPSDCFLNVPFLLGLTLAVGVVLFFAGGWLGIGGTLGIGFIAGFGGAIEFGTPLTITDPSDPRVARVQDLIDQNAQLRPPGSDGPDLEDIAACANPTGGAQNCGSIAEALDSVLAGQAAVERGIGDVNNAMLDSRELNYFHDMPAGGDIHSFLPGMLLEAEPSSRSNRTGPGMFSTR